MNSDSLSLTLPDDWHLHLRDDEALHTTVPHSARSFGRAIVMPNLKSPITTVDAALDYRDRILSYVPQSNQFQPLMTLYLTDSLSTQEIDKAQESECVVAVKYYPAGATTNSDSGVTEISKVYPVLERMIEHDMPLLVHGEVTDPGIDIFDRERQFIQTILEPLISRYPTLKLVLEHITTSYAVDFIQQQPANVAATITAHHLLYNRNDLLAGGVRPHFYCLPVLKRSSHQQVLIEAAISGNASFFLGTDSAPHGKATKETECGCAGIYSAPAAIELYAEVFDSHAALDKLEAFASFYGADFYGLPRNQSSITLLRKDWHMPSEYKLAGDVVVPIRAGDTIAWQLEPQF
ncbi:MAG TPA: dihydroorotase [Gammaproteobacteria bacterium]|jgi:dihydroorotase|nr:dihydroorotase [Gammaproteobacteria bacterium]MDP6732976.1 dihydroorotase [Gammaproteobacteria bacterium]HAJ76762.1 dihydroorotase [Gammaproteobacteria bacterium]